MSASAFLKGQFRPRIMIYNTIETENLINFEKLFLSTLLDYDLPRKCFEDICELLEDIYKHTKCKNYFFTF